MMGFNFQSNQFIRNRTGTYVSMRPCKGESGRRTTKGTASRDFRPWFMHQTFHLATECYFKRISIFLQIRGDMYGT